jgi:hypothetical protein
VTVISDGADILKQFPRAGLRIARTLAESAVNSLVAKRM